MLKFYVLFLGLFCFSISAQELSLSARLSQPDGSPLEGVVDLRFELSYSGAPETVICTKDMSGTSLTNGLFQLGLNFSTAECGGSSLSDVLEGVPVSEAMLFRVVDVTDPANPRTYPFQSLKAVPLSVRSEVAQTLARNSAVEGQVLRFVGGEWTASNETAEVGTVSEINTGAGLTGGPITSAGTIAIASGGVTSAMVADGTLVNADLSATAAIARTKIATGNANYILVNDGSGVMSEIAILPLTSGGTGAANAADARFNLGLGNAALRNVGLLAGELLDSGEIPSCALDEKIRKVVMPVAGFICESGADATKLALAGGTMSGPIDMNSNTIANLADPSLAQDAATKAYVDGQIGGGAANQWSESGGNVYRSSGNVGIGTSDPLYKLDVRGGTASSFTRADATSHAHHLLFRKSGGDDSSPSVAANNSTVMALWGLAYDGDSYDSVFRINGSIDGNISDGVTPGKIDFLTSDPGTNALSSKMTIKSNGFVGIGTNDPFSLLDVESTGLSQSASLRLTGTNSASSQSQVSMLSSYQPAGGLAGDAALDIKVRKDGEPFESPSTLMTLRGDTGFVGIGVLTPQAKLDINGQIKISGGSPGAGKVLTSDAAGLASWVAPSTTATPTGAASGDLTGNYPGPVIAPGAVTDAKVAAGANIAQSKIANLTTDLAAKQAADSDLTGLSNLVTNGVMVRTGSGTYQTRALQGATNRTVVTNGDGVSGNPTLDVSTSLLPSPLAGDATRFLRATGVNTASWQALLGSDITTALGYTPINKAGDSIGSGVFDFNSTAVVRANNPVGTRDIANKSYVDTQVSSAANQWTAAGGNVYRASGNVGIGTNFPASLLEVKAPSPVVGSIFTPLVLSNPIGGLQDGGGSGVGISFAGDIAKGKLFYERRGSFGRGDFHFLQNRIGDTSTAELVDSVLTIKNNGNVGIGTTAPSQRLHLNDSSANSTYVKISNSVSAGGTDFGVNSVGAGVIYQRDNQPLILGTNNLERMRINSNGDIGVGATAPNEKVHLSASAGNMNLMLEGTSDVVNPSIMFKGNTSFLTDGVQLRYDNPTGKFFIDSQLTQSVHFRNSVGTSAIDTLTISPSGNVGIGTVNPTHKLEVNGDLKVSGNIVGGASNIFRLQRSIPTVVDEYVEIGGFVALHGATNIRVSVTVNDGNFSRSKQYLLPIGYGQNLDVWQTAIPIAQDGWSGTQEFSLDVRVDLASTFLRLRRLAGVEVGTADILIEDTGSLTSIFTETSGTGVADPVTSFFGSTALTQKNGRVGIATSTPVGKLFVGSDWRTSNGGVNLFLNQSRPGGSSTNDLGITYSTTNSSTTDPMLPGLTLYNDDATAGGWSPMLVFAKAESGGSAFKTGTAAIGARSPLGTGNGDSWIDGELHFYTSGAATLGLTSRMVIDKSGNVGIGIPTPGYGLQVAGTASVNNKLWASYGNPVMNGYSWVDAAFTTNSIEIVNNNGSDPTKAATLAFHTHGFGGPQFRLDSNGSKVLYLESSNANSARVPSPYGGGSNQYFSRFHVDGDLSTVGRVGIGTTAPAYNLDVTGDLRITGTPYRNGGDTAWTIPSDERLKDIADTYEYGLNEIASLDTYRYSYKENNSKKIDSSKVYTGVMAQQVQQYIPDAVETDKDGFLALNTTPIFWAMVNSIKDLFEYILKVESSQEEQKRELASKADRSEIEQLKKENAELKSYLCQKDPQAPFCL